jgi:competence protein ComEA
MPQAPFPQHVAGIAMLNRHLVVVGGLILLVVAASVWFGRNPADPAPLLVESTAPADPGHVTLHVSGEVASPGLVVVAENARVADAIAAAGGSTRAADLASINIAAPVQDGDQIVIPSLAERTSAAGSAADDGRVRINRATAQELEELPGVGPVLAARIAAYRDENGLFRSVEDLLDVPGIGEGKLATLRDSVALP